MIGERLQMMRKRRGLSLRALSDRLGNAVSAQALSKYEREDFAPGSDMLIRLADALETSVDYLMERQIVELATDDVRFRKTARFPARERARVNSAIVDFLQGCHQIEQILDIGIPQCGKPRRLEMSRIEEFAEQLRRDWKLGLDPIASMAGLLEHHRIRICALDLPEKVSGLHCAATVKGSGQRISAIIINRRHNRERRRMSMAHELFHYMAHCPEDDEKAANLFAGAFLMPRRHFLAEVGKHRKRIIAEEIMLLKRIYGVSAMAVLMRLNALDVLDDNALAYACRSYARKWRTEEPRPLPDEPHNNPELPSNFRKLCIRALSEGLISIRKAAVLLKISPPEAADIARSLLQCR